MRAGYDIAMRRCLLLAVTVLLLGLPAQSNAQTYPNRPIRLISPFAAGGANDVLARVLASKLAERLPGTVVVENRPGAGAVVGLVAVARAAPDGYTLGLSGSTLAVAGALHKNPPFDAMKDFVPIALVTHWPFILTITPSLPARSVAELIALARQQPGKLFYASPGVATSQHLYGELFKSMTGTDIAHVPYNGASPAVVDIVAGRVQIMFVAAAGSLPLIREGKLRALAVTSAERLKEAPEIPPLIDDLPGFDALNWAIVLAPAGTPKEIAERLHHELKAIMAMAEVEQQVARIGMIPIITPPPAGIQAFVTAEVARWSKILQQAGIAGAQ
jgi:tripartite-type tricarboxylate transporter receptor subunit TctC